MNSITDCVDACLKAKGGIAAIAALVFVLVGTSVVLPFIVGYTFWSYRIFRGKATGGDPYG